MTLSLTAAYTTSLLRHPRLAAERALGLSRIIIDYVTAQDELTQHLRDFQNEHPWAVYPNCAPESYRRFYSSLRYPTAQDAEAAFARTAHSLVYGRDGTPDGDRLTQGLLFLDPAATAGRVTAHGMSAIEAALLGAKSGEHIVASNQIFGTTKRNLQDLLQEKGISVTFVDGRSPAAWEAAIRPTTSLFFYEPVGNPGMERANTRAIAAIAHRKERDILVVADNSLTPLDQSLTKGADIVAFSTTKLCGLGTDNGGAILVSEKGMKRLARRFPGSPAGYPVLVRASRKGLTQNHRSAAVMLNRLAFGLLRHKHQIAIAATLSTLLRDSHPDLVIQSIALDRTAHITEHSQVFSLDLGTKEAAFAFINALADQGIGIVNNFGSPRTSVIHPSSTTQSALSLEERRAQGISEGLVRISVGIESPHYLHRLIKHALAQAAEKTAKPAPHSRAAGVLATPTR